MDFGALPPEINSGRMYAGPGAGSMLAAAAAWDGLATDLYSTATSYQSVISSLTGGSWLGPASTSMAAAAAPYVTWVSTTAAECEQVATQARAAASAYEAAFAMTVPPPVIAVNRAQLMSLVATNFLGQNTPAIAATEAHYGEMWAQDAAAMYGYAGSSAAASTLTPFTPPTQTTNPAGLESQSAAVAQAAGASVGTHAQTMTSSMSAVPQALQGLAQPLQSTSSTGASLASSGAYAPASALSGLTGALGKGVFKGASTGTAATAGMGEAAGLGSDAFGVGSDVAGLGGDGLGLGADLLGGEAVGEGEVAIGAAGLPTVGGLGVSGPLGGLGALGPLGGVGVSASMGQAPALGALSVPQSWPEALQAGTMSPASAVALPGILPGAHLGAAPAVSTGGPSMPKMPLANMAGRGADGAVQWIGLRPTVLPHSPMAG